MSPTADRFNPDILRTMPGTRPRNNTQHDRPLLTALLNRMQRLECVLCFLVAWLDHR